MFLLEFVGLVVCTFFLLKFVLRKNKLHGIPGPKGWPVLGNTLQVDMEKPHVTLLEWAKKYGSVYKINLAGTDTIIAVGTQALHEVLVSKDGDFADREVMYRLKVWSMNCSDVIFSGYNKKFKWMKKFMLKGLKQHNLKYIETLTLEVLDDMLEDITKIECKPFDPSNTVYSLLFQIIYAMVFSQKIRKTDQKFLKIRRFDEETAEAVSFVGPNALLDLFPWLRFFGHKAYKQLMEVHSIGRELCAEWKNQLQKGEMKECWYTELLEAQRSNPSFLSDENVMMMIMDFFIGGTMTTTSSLLTWLNILAHYPEVQKNIQREVDYHIGESWNITFSDREKMPYTFACVLETLRYMTS